MQTKLTLRLDDALIRKAKQFSSKSGKSVSRLVEDYFAAIGSGLDASGEDLTPRVRSLLGVLAGSHVSETDYKRHIEAKHR
jgi:hypothetical protein